MRMVAVYLDGKVQDVCEASNVCQRPLETIKKLCKLVNERSVVGCIVNGDGEDLTEMCECVVSFYNQQLPFYGCRSSLSTR